MEKIRVEHLNFYYGGKIALSDISISIQDRRITALIGPSGCGKSTFLRCLNRMNDTIRGARAEGRVLLDGRDIYARGTDVVELRMRGGDGVSAAQSLSQSIFENIAFGPRSSACTATGTSWNRLSREPPGRRAVGRSERQTQTGAFGLSLGQQQRLCIAAPLR